MSKLPSKTVVRILTILFWVVLFGLFTNWVRQGGVDVRHLPMAGRNFVRHAGTWGPPYILMAYVIRIFLLLPSSILELVSGSVYGPVWGSVLNIVGLNVSASLAFWIGRFLGRDYLSKKEHGLVKSYDEAMTRDGFSAVMAMRLLFVPFDVVNYAAGMTGIKYRDYAWATFLGILPGTIAFTVAGDNIGKPGGFLVFLGLSILIVGLVLILKAHPWTKAVLSRNKEA